MKTIDALNTTTALSVSERAARCALSEMKAKILGRTNYNYYHVYVSKCFPYVIRNLGTAEMQIEQMTMIKIKT